MKSVTRTFSFGEDEERRRRSIVFLVFCVSHQLTVLQRVDELSVLTGQDGARQIQHHADCRQQHEEGDLRRDGKKERTDCQIHDLPEYKQNMMWTNVSLRLVSALVSQDDMERKSDRFYYLSLV